MAIGISIDSIEPHYEHEERYHVAQCRECGWESELEFNPRDLPEICGSCDSDYIEKRSEWA